MIINGVDVDSLGDDFGLPSNGKTLIIDGDGPAYVAAATVKTVPTGLRRFQSQILESIFLAECEQGEVFLTHEESYKAGRFTIKAVKPYQGNRQGGAKPPLLSQVREIAEQEGAMNEFDVHMERVLEADDAMMMLSYALGEKGVMRSEDKDLRMTPWPYYDIKRGVVMPSDPFGELWIEETPSGAKKLVGRSLKFFWAQMVMGDTADNIKGLLKLDGKNVGLTGAYDLLHPLRDIEAVCNTVIDAYRAIDQNPLPEAWLLWMLRHPADNVWRYFGELPFSTANRAYLDECVTRDWFTHA
ncbi:exonuclease [Ralstonia phage RSB3]|uniref:Putative exonuclease n=1 Tax=Ralstonia phage RSB3 TaxID=1402875 RepID=U3TFM5_9CAUD|nr:exonuclease [Ralstonia phage RSB3]BAN92337.1 putative exonuclease [Ralstonia phage RSB3]